MKNENDTIATYPTKKLTIVGGGLIGFLEAYFAYLDAKKAKQTIRITIHEKNSQLLDTTTAHIVPSLTPDEILCVVPRGQEFVHKLQIPFNQPGGIRVDDVEGINDSQVTQQFLQAVKVYSADEEGHAQRTDILLRFGQQSMALWQFIYDHADAELKAILHEANYNPCQDLLNSESPKLHQGYRIDLIYNIPQAAAKAHAMKTIYEELGYKQCKLLSPKEVEQLDPFLHDFCQQHSYLHEDNVRVWRDDAIALWRPGGCIDTQILLPKLANYLKKVMGQYINEQGKQQDCFQIHFNRQVTQLSYEKDYNRINGLSFFASNSLKPNKHPYLDNEYVFCPGEAVGTLRNLGLEEPDYARFAGASLMLNIPLAANQVTNYVHFNHCMEVHQEGIVLAWQARFKDNHIFIGVAGTKAYYADKAPDKNQAFAKDRNLLQLNMINDVLPHFLSLALGRDTQGQRLTQQDLDTLEQQGIARRWAGSRAVAADNFPTLGSIYNSQGKVVNGRCTTHLGSGGGSFGPESVLKSRSIFQPNPDEFTKTVLNYADSSRKYSPT